jgi:hypothetical protein
MKHKLFLHSEKKAEARKQKEIDRHVLRDIIN